MIFCLRNGTLKYSSEVYKNQPGRIEDYEPGRSSIAEKEAKEVRKVYLLEFDPSLSFFSFFFSLCIHTNSFENIFLPLHRNSLYNTWTKIIAQIIAKDTGKLSWLPLTEKKYHDLLTIHNFKFLNRILNF